MVWPYSYGGGVLRKQILSSLRGAGGVGGDICNRQRGLKVGWSGSTSDHLQVRRCLSQGRGFLWWESWEGADTSGLQRPECPAAGASPERCSWGPSAQPPPGSSPASPLLMGGPRQSSGQNWVHRVLTRVPASRAPCRRGQGIDLRPCFFSVGPTGPFRPPGYRSSDFRVFEMQDPHLHEGFSGRFKQIRARESGTSREVTVMTKPHLCPAGSLTQGSCGHGPEDLPVPTTDALGGP